MPTQIELIAEAGRRGILPADKKPLYDEAVRRGLIKAGAAKPSVDMFDTVADQALQGATFGIGNRISAGLAAGVATLAGVNDKSLPENYKLAREIGSARLSEEMDQNPGAAIISNLAGGLATGGLAAGTKAGSAIGNSIRSGGVGARIAKGAVSGAASGAAYGAGSADYGKSGEGAEQGALYGAVLGGAGSGLASAAGKVKDVLMPKVNSAVKSTVELAQKHDIPIAIDQVTNSKARQYLASASSRIPLGGGKEFAESQQKAFNRAVLKTVSVNADTVTDDVVQSAYDTIGKKFDDVLSGQNIQLTNAHKDRLRNIVDNARKSVSADKVKAIKANVDEVIGNAAKNGMISGEKISDLRSTITARLRKADPGVKQYLADLIDEIVDISTNGNPAVKDKLRQARYEWKNLKTIEPLLAKASDGNISPALLRGAVSKKSSFGAKAMSTGSAGDLGELARVGALIKQKIGDSGTAERLASYGLLAAPGAAYGAYNDNSLGGALTGALGTIAAARGYNKYNTAAPLLNGAMKASAPKITKRGIGLLSGNIAGLLTQ
jgi:hypothetical protein